MQRGRLNSGLGLLLAALVLAACVQSAVPLLAGMDSATPLPDDFVLVMAGDKPDANRFAREGDVYVDLDDSSRAAYRLVALDDRVGASGPFFMAVVTNGRSTGADYGLAEITSVEIVVHGFDARELAASLGMPVGDYGVDVETDGDLLTLFRRVASDAVAGKTKTAHYRVLDLADPAQRAEAEIALEQTRKAREAE